jgi:hypothetical protein
LTNAGNPVVPDQPLMKLIQVEAPDLARETIGPYLESARLLGHRTAELHLALGSRSTDPAFAPEPFTELYRRSLYQSMRNSTNQNFDLLRQRLPGLSEEERAFARKVLERRGEVLDNFRQLTAQPLEASRIRCHGDYHLGQVLYTGGNFDSLVKSPWHSWATQGIMGQNGLDAAPDRGEEHVSRARPPREPIPIGVPGDAQEGQADAAKLGRGLPKPGPSPH